MMREIFVCAQKYLFCVLIMKTLRNIRERLKRTITSSNDDKNGNFTFVGKLLNFSIMKISSFDLIHINYKKQKLMCF